MKAISAAIMFIAMMFLGVHLAYGNSGKGYWLTGSLLYYHPISLLTWIVALMALALWLKEMFKNEK